MNIRLVVSSQSSRRIFAATAMALAGLVAGMGPAMAVDTTPPALVTPVKSSFLVGSQLGQESGYDCDGYVHTAGDGKIVLSVTQTFKLSATDASPFSYSYVEENAGYGPGDPIYLGSQNMLTVPTTSNANNDCGGPNNTIYRWYITATDSGRSATTKVVTGAHFSITQQNNVHDVSQYAQSPTISYSSGWTTASCACWSDGAVVKTSTKGASASFAIKAAAENPTHVGLVMHKGPDRGKFQVLIDGKLNATVDLYSAGNLPRSIVWQAAIQKNSTIKIVNLATSGRARIDLDAVLTN